MEKKEVFKYIRYLEFNRTLWMADEWSTKYKEHKEDNLGKYVDGNMFCY